MVAWRWTGRGVPAKWRLERRGASPECKLEKKETVVWKGNKWFHKKRERLFYFILWWWFGNRRVWEARGDGDVDVVVVRAIASSCCCGGRTDGPGRLTRSEVGDGRTTWGAVVGAVGASVKPKHKPNRAMVFLVAAAAESWAPVVSLSPAASANKGQLAASSLRASDPSWMLHSKTDWWGIHESSRSKVKVVAACLHVGHDRWTTTACLLTARGYYL